MNPRNCIVHPTALILLRHVNHKQRNIQYGVYKNFLTPDSAIHESGLVTEYLSALKCYQSVIMMNEKICHECMCIFMSHIIFISFSPLSVWNGSCTVIMLNDANVSVLTCHLHLMSITVLEH